MRSTCCVQPPTLGALGFSKRAPRVAPWGTTGWELPVRRKWYGVDHGRRPRPGQTGLFGCRALAIVQERRGLGGQPPLAGTPLGPARRFLKGRWARIRVRVTCSPPEAWPKRPGVGLHPPWGASSISAGAVLWSVAARQGFAFGEAVSFDEDADRRPDDAIRCQRSLEVDCPVLGVGHDD